jgi:hypothetical protein
MNAATAVCSAYKYASIPNKSVTTCHCFASSLPCLFTLLHNLDMGNQLSMADDSACTGTAHQHDTIALEDAVDHLRRMPHMQQGSLMLQYANKTHQALELQFKTDAPLPCR